MLAADLAFLEELQAKSFARASTATTSSYPPERRMDARGLAAYLERRRYLLVATVRGSGRPHAAMSAFVFAGERFWLPTMEGTARARNLADRPYASLVVADGDGADHKAILTEGPAELRAAPSAQAVDSWEDRDGALPEWADRWIELRPVKLFSYDAGAPEHAVVGWRCDSCGDAYTAATGELPICPSCGGERATIASEPFL